MIEGTGSGSGAARNHDRRRCRRLGLIHHVEDVERLPAERIGRRRPGIDRRQIGLIGAWFGVRRHLAIAVGPPPAPAATTAPAGTMLVLAGLGMVPERLRHAPRPARLRRRPARPPPRLPAPAAVSSRRPPRRRRRRLWRRRSASSAVSPATRRPHRPRHSASASASASSSSSSTAAASSSASISAGGSATSWVIATGASAATCARTPLDAELRGHLAIVAETQHAHAVALLDLAPAARACG